MEMESEKEVDKAKGGGGERNRGKTWEGKEEKGKWEGLWIVNV